MSNVKELITAIRPNTHGEFRDVAAVDQATKDLWRSRQNWEHLLPHQRCALEMIAHKIGRILSGDPHFRDHWIDIAGYAQLVADRCQKNNE